MKFLDLLPKDKRRATENAGLENAASKRNGVKYEICDP